MCFFLTDAGIRGMPHARGRETRQARHAGTLGSGVDAAVLGVYVHCLLLSTENILVPIVAHAVFDAILFVAGHLNVGIKRMCILPTRLCVS